MVLEVLILVSVFHTSLVHEMFLCNNYYSPMTDCYGSSFLLVASNQSWLHDVEKLNNIINNSLNVSTPSLNNQLLWPSKLSHRRSLGVTMTTVSALTTNQIAAEFEKDEFMEWEEEGGAIHDMMMSSLHHEIPETSKTSTLSWFRRLL